MGAHISHLGNIAVGENQWANLHAEMLDELVDTTPVPELPSAEQSQSQHEKITSLLDNSAIILTTWSTGRSTKPKYDLKFGGSCCKTLSNESIPLDRAEQIVSKQTKLADLAAINSKHISEVITLTSLDDSPFAAYMPNSPKGKADVTVFTYETTKGNVGYRMAGPSTSPKDNYIRYHLILPREQAAELRNMVTENPTIVRDLTKAVEVDYFGIPEDEYSSLGPHYEDWKQINGGVNRIIVREGFDAPLRTADVVEF